MLEQCRRSLDRREESFAKANHGLKEANDKVKRLSSLHTASLEEASASVAGAGPINKEFTATISNTIDAAVVKAEARRGQSDQDRSSNEQLPIKGKRESKAIKEEEAEDASRLYEVGVAYGYIKEKEGKSKNALTMESMKIETDRGKKKG